MKKFCLIAAAALLIVGTAVSLSACGREALPPLVTDTPPATTPYVPDNLPIEWFETAYTNMTPWQRYPAESSSPEEREGGEKTPEENPDIDPK